MLFTSLGRFVGGWSSRSSLTTTKSDNYGKNGNLPRVPVSALLKLACWCQRFFEIEQGGDVCQRSWPPPAHCESELPSSGLELSSGGPAQENIGDVESDCRSTVANPCEADGGAP
jgi:hypothetical protein